MQVALLANSSWLDDELAQFHRLVVGLIDEQVRVTQVVPDDLPEQQAIPFGARLTWRDTPWTPPRRHRLKSLAGSLDKLGVDLIHALDGQLWDASVRLSCKLQVPAVLAASCQADLARLSRLVRHASNNRLAFVAATRPLARALEDTLGADALVELVPPGVHLASRDGAQPSDGQSLCAVITGTGKADADYEELFAAISLILVDYPRSQFFLHGRRADQHSLWQLAERFELLGNVSLVPHRLVHNELLTGAQVLIQPQPLGRARTLTLQAMAQAMTVLARADAGLDYLIDNKTAWVVEQHDPSRWAQLLRRVIGEPQRAMALGASAQQWVGQRHRASQQVARTLDVYRRACGETIKFPR